MPEIPSGEYFLELRFTLRDSTNWAEAGHEVAFGQIPLAPAASFTVLKSISPSTAPQVKQISPQLLSITSSSDVEWKFNIVHGTLTSWLSTGVELIEKPPMLDFYRAQTDNDSPSEFGTSWISAYLHQTKQHVRSVSWTSGKNDLKIVVNARIAPPVLEWSVDATFTYTFTDKHISIHVKGEPKGLNVPPTFARIGLTLSLNGVETAEWFGRGPGESYSDKKLSQRLGTWSAPIDDLFTHYEFPQETGNRTDTRWVHFKGKQGVSLKAAFGDLDGASFSALNYTTKDIDECKHPYELYKRRKRRRLLGWIGLTMDLERGAVVQLHCRNMH